MISRLQLISIAPATPYLNVAAIDQVVGSFGDWIRINGYTWLLWSQKTTADTSVAIRNVLSTGDVVVCIYANPKEAAGFAPQWLWDWINSKIILHIPH